MSEDLALELAADQLADAQQLRRALQGLVDAVRAEPIKPTAIAAALDSADVALENTSHTGWMRRMEARRAAMLAERLAECRVAGRHLLIRMESGEHPRCDHCEQPVQMTEPDAEGWSKLAPP